MIDSINRSGKLTETKAKWPFYGRSFKTVDDWFITLPTEEKYEKYNELTAAVVRIKLLRKIIWVTSTVMIIAGIVLMATLD